MSPLLRSLACIAAAALPASAAVTSATPSSFLITHRVEVEATPTAVYNAIGQPAQWWNAEHTYSGKAANLRTRLVVGGCFCEAWDRNAVEHGRVISVAPGQRVRMQAELGPLQEMAVMGILDFRIEPRGPGSTITMTYRVRGSADAALDKIAPNVDKVMVDQVQRLAAYVDAPPPNARKLAVEERFADAGGARIRYLEMGTGEPVILLHDAGATSEQQWRDTGLMRAIADNFRALAVDASRPEDVLKLMDALAIPKAHVVGYGLGAEIAAKLAVSHPERLQTLTLAGATSLRSDTPPDDRRELAVRDADMIALPVPTLGIVGLQDPAARDFIELKRVMPRFVRMVAIEGATHASTLSSPDFAVALMYFLRYNPMPK